MADLPHPHQRLLEWIEMQISQGFYSPTLRQMQQAMGKRSLSPIQNSLAYLRERGYLTWRGKRSRTYTILRPLTLGIRVEGYINAHSLMEAYTDETPTFVPIHEFLASLKRPRQEIAHAFALIVRGDSMIGAQIQNGDLVIMRRCPEQVVKNGSIVAARVEGQTTLKHYYREGDIAILKPANPDYSETRIAANQVEIQGVMLAVLRWFD